MSDFPVYQSRRERREAEAKLVPVAIDQFPTTSNLNPSTPPEEIHSPQIIFEPVKPADFGSTTNLGAEPVSASIIISSVPDLESNQIIITESGGILRTGSIELPKIDPILEASRLSARVKKPMKQLRRIA